MKLKVSQSVVALICVAASGLVFAQGSDSGGDAKERSVQKPGMGMNSKAGMNGCCGPNDTMGWSMMDRKERNEHHTRMHAMKSFDECKAYVDDHHAKMRARAKEAGRAMPAEPRNYACSWLKK
jgi:hypothetical protein